MMPAGLQTFHQRLQGHLLSIPSPHRLPIHAQCERGVDVPHLVQIGARLAIPVPKRVDVKVGSNELGSCHERDAMRSGGRRGSGESNRVL